MADDDLKQEDAIQVKEIFRESKVNTDALSSVKPFAKKGEKRQRANRPYPVAPFEEALELGCHIQSVASGEKVRRLTLLKQLNRSDTSSATRMMITNSGKYGITTGGYTAEYLELTPDGSIATSLETPFKEQLNARFKLAIEGIEPFNILYKEYRGKRLPEKEVMKDILRNAGYSSERLNECVDLFVVNSKFLGLLQLVGGKETVVPIDHLLEDLPTKSTINLSEEKESLSNPSKPSSEIVSSNDWEKTCFYIAPIGEEGSEARQHSDLFLNYIVEPALSEFGMKVVRADKIGASGLITKQIFEFLTRAKLAVVDLSMHNPNVFYELAIRHATRLPIVQIIRKRDRIPFDIHQVRTIVVDDSSIYTLVPQLETYKSEIATQVRTAISLLDETSNPLTLFCPNLKITLPP